MGRRVLITGGAGFIGSNLVESILRNGDDVRVVDDFSTGRRQNLAAATEWASAGKGRYELVEGDIRDAEAVSALFSRERPDGVAHLAALAGVRPSLERPAAYADVNVTGTAVLLEEAARHGAPRGVAHRATACRGTEKGSK